jgi:hypothetical protein
MNCFVEDDKLDEEEYRVWWAMHIRMAKGETLTAVELGDYNAGLRLLDAEDARTMRQGGGLNSLRDMRQRVLAAHAEHQRLANQYETMRSEMARLESLLDDQTRLALGVGR